jgi:hypothetical protein
MNQSVHKTRMLLSIGAIVLVVFFGFGNISSSQSYSSINHGNSHTAPGDTYPGPSHDYTMTPNPCSLTYSGPCSYQSVAAPPVRQELAKAE